MTALAWLIAAVLLVAAEVLVGELVLLMLGGGALAAAVTAFFFDVPAWVPIVVFAVVSLLLLLVVRPVARRHLLQRPAVPSNAEALLGNTAVVLAPVDAYQGRVKIGGDVWSARSAGPEYSYGQGENLVVLQIDGATAVVGKGE